MNMQICLGSNSNFICSKPIQPTTDSSIHWHPITGQQQLCSGAGNIPTTNPEHCSSSSTTATVAASATTAESPTTVEPVTATDHPVSPASSAAADPRATGTPTYHVVTTNLPATDYQPLDILSTNHPAGPPTTVLSATHGPAAVTADSTTTATHDSATTTATSAAAATSPDTDTTVATTNQVSTTSTSTDSQRTEKCAQQATFV